MVSKLINRFKYYLVLGIKKPYLIKSFIYKKHLGVIISIPVKQMMFESNDLTISNSQNIKEISEFYKKMDRDSINSNEIKKWLNQGHECFLVNFDNQTVGSMWIFKNKFNLNGLSGRTLSKEKTVCFEQNSIYGANVIIDANYRGKGINQHLLNYVLNHYASNTDYKYKSLIVITGASNGAYIRSAMKYNGSLIGITEVKNYLGKSYRKEIFLDKKEKTWK